MLVVVFFDTHLLYWTLCLKQNAASQKLSKNAAHRPHVDSGRVVTCAHQDLGGPIVLRDHLLRHVLGLVWFLYTCQSKITDLQHAVAVYQQVARLYVPMQDAGRVQILKTAQDLVQKHLDVVLGQVLWRYNYFVQIRLQELCYHIAKVEANGVWVLKESIK